MSENKIIYRRDANVTAQQVADVFTRSGIKRPVEDLSRIDTMLQNSNLTWTAWDGDKLVGIARSLTDFGWCCYLSDLAVDEGYQKAGIGRELVRKTRETIGPTVALLLLSAPGAMEYYPKIGFEQVFNGFQIKRAD